jgi:hypothetical protein
MIMNMIRVYVHNLVQLYTLWIVDGLRKIAITNSTFYLSILEGTFLSPYGALQMVERAP